MRAMTLGECFARVAGDRGRGECFARNAGDRGRGGDAGSPGTPRTAAGAVTAWVTVHSGRGGDAGSPGTSVTAGRDVRCVTTGTGACYQGEALADTYGRS